MPARVKPSYRVEDIEIDTQRCCVRYGGQERYLRRQAFQVLVYLLEQRHRAVTKDELIEKFWHDTAVTDNALVQCILDIRKGLGDHARNPQYIKTVPKVGYRFVGPAEEQWAEEPPEGKANEGVAPQAEAGDKAVEAAVPEAPPQPAPVASGKPWLLARIANRGKHWLRPGRRLVMVCAAAGLLALVAVWILAPALGRSHADIALQRIAGKKALAVMFFENESGRPELDWLREGLADMLITNLGRSKQFTLLSRRQLRTLLERANYQPSGAIRLDEALEIGRRSHADAVVLGGFMAFGDQIRISVQLRNVSDGQILGTEQLTANRPSEILSLADLLSHRLSYRLGAPSSGQRGGLAETMTDNLEAYQYYSLGVQKARAFDNAEAVRLLEKAVELDSNFAMAHARIGYAYAVTGFMPEMGRPYLERASRLSARLSEQDRLDVDAWHAIARRDYPVAVRLFQQIVAQYPNEPEGYARLGYLLLCQEHFDEAVSVLKRGLEIDPEAENLWYSLALVLTGMGPAGEAIAANQHYVALAPNEANAHDSLGLCYEAFGRYDEAIAEFQRALSLNPGFEPAVVHLGHVYFRQGRYKQAIAQYQQSIRDGRFDIARARGYSNVAQVLLKKGDLRGAEEAARSEVRYEKDALWNSIVLALARNEKARVTDLKERFFAGPPGQHTPGMWLDPRSAAYFRGYLALKSGARDEAIAQFKEAVRHLSPAILINVYEDCLANAYLELGQYNDAIREYQRILNLNPNYPLVHYHLAEAYKGQGDSSQAQTEYALSLQVWKNADPDIPEVIRARRNLSGAAPASH